jgi:hypothetical protein
MAKDPNHLAGYEADNSGGLLSGLLAEEDEFDRRSLVRLGAWALAATAIVIVAMLANQSSMGLRRDQIAAADLARQAQQIQSVAKESQNEARRLSSAIDTLNGDRDRLYSRVTVLEQGLDSVTGAIARQNPGVGPPQVLSATPAITAAVTPSSASAEPSHAVQSPSAPPAMSPVATTPAKTADRINANAAAAEVTQALLSQGAPASPPTSQAASTLLVPPKSMIGPPDSAAAKLIEPEKPTSVVTSAPMPEVAASVVPGAEAEADASQTLPKVAVQRTEFGVDVGGANSVNGLRALWRGLLKSRSNAPLATLQPIIVIRESNTGLGMQLRLVAGPLSDAAAAAKICAAMIESQRACETAVFDGQRLAMKPEEPPASAKSAVKPGSRRYGTTRRVTIEEPQRAETSTASSLFGR